jgi:hypothetical protein
LRNDITGARGHWLSLRLEGTKSNRSAIGARVVLKYGGKTQARAVLSQTGFYSSDDLRVFFGLGEATSASAVVYWPSGLVEEFQFTEVDRPVYLKEGADARPRPEAAKPQP